jgi:glycerol-3-phosphate dehydrogenase subunit B
VTGEGGRGTDAVVVGAGLAGLVAAVRLAEAGLRVVVVAKGLGCLRLAPATIDILGYAPERVTSPAGELPAFAAAHPGHPYTRVPPGVLAESVAWLKERVTGYAYVGDPGANMLLPTAVGAVRPSAVVPETMAGGDLRSARHLAIAGLAVLKDFHPAMVADNLRAAALPGPPVEATSIMLSPPTGGEAELSPIALARRFEEPSFRGAVAAGLRAALGDEQAVGLPAVLGLGQVRSVWEDLKEAIGRPVFEIPTIPPSVPGVRLATALQDRLRRAGGRLMLGAEAVGPEPRNGTLAGIRVRTAAREVTRAARWVVLATGGLASGGIDVDVTGAARESVLGLPVPGAPAPGVPAFLPGFFDEHPMDLAGVAVDERLRPTGPDGVPVYENVHAAGAIIGGARPWREKSGDGISLVTGYMAASEILREAGVSPETGQVSSP